MTLPTQKLQLGYASGKTVRKRENVKRVVEDLHQISCNLEAQLAPPMYEESTQNKAKKKRLLLMYLP